MITEPRIQSKSTVTVTVEGLSPHEWVDANGQRHRERSVTGFYDDTPEGHAAARQAAKDKAASPQHLDGDNDGWTFRAIRVTRTVVTTTTDTAETL